jgi:precorrin-6B methylase 2
MKTLCLRDITKQVTTLSVAERYFDSFVLFALFDAGVLQHLASGPKSLGELQARIRGDEESLRAALDAAVALKVLSREGHRYAAADAILDCLGRHDSPAYIGEWVTLMHRLATPLSRLGEEIRTGCKPGALFEDMSGDNPQASAFTRAMDAYARTRGIEIADRVDFSQTRRLLDLGCGPGTYSLAILERFPSAHATLLDLPGAIAEARRIAAERGMSDRIAFVASDGMDYRPKEPFDTILVSNTLHMIGPEGSIALLERCCGMMAPGGRMIVQAQFLNDDRTSPRWATLLNLIQRVGTPHGRNHAIGETKQWLRRAGFADIEYVPLSVWNVCSCLIGKKPVR